MAMSDLPSQNSAAEAQVPAGSESVEDVIKSLVNFSQVVSKTLCSLQNNITNLTEVVELHAKEIAELRELIKSNMNQSDPMTSGDVGTSTFDDDDETKKYEELLNKMQMRRSTMTYPVDIPMPTSKKESNISDAKAKILAAAREFVTIAGAGAE